MISLLSKNCHFPFCLTGELGEFHKGALGLNMFGKSTPSHYALTEKGYILKLLKDPESENSSLVTLPTY